MVGRTNWVFPQMKRTYTALSDLPHLPISGIGGRQPRKGPGWCAPPELKHGHLFPILRLLKVSMKRGKLILDLEIHKRGNFI